MKDCNVGVIDVVGCLPQYSVPVNFGSRRNLNKNTVLHLKRLSAKYHRFNLRKHKLAYCSYCMKI